MTTIERRNVVPPRRRAARTEPEDPPARPGRAKTKDEGPRERRKAERPEAAQSKAKEGMPKTRTPRKRTLTPAKARTEAAPTRPARSPQKTAPAGKPKTARSSGSVRSGRSPVRPRPTTGRPRAPFVLLILCLLGGALVSLLVLNTVLARDAYTLSALESSERRLTQQKQTLVEEIAREESPGRLALKARNQGMVQPSELAFVDPGNGRVTGGRKRPVPPVAAAAAAAAGVIGVPGAIVPGDGIPGWNGDAEPRQPQRQAEPERTP